MTGVPALIGIRLLVLCFQPFVVKAAASIRASKGPAAICTSWIRTAMAAIWRSQPSGSAGVTSSRPGRRVMTMAGCPSDSRPSASAAIGSGAGSPASDTARSIDRQDRRRQGKSDPLDAVSAARAAQSGRARGAPKGRDGAVEAIRALMVAKRSARSERTQAINQARALIVTGPDDLRARFTAHATADLVTELATLRPRPGAVVGFHTRIALRELGRRAEFLDRQIICLDALIVPLVTGHAPGLLALHGVGADTAAILLIAAGDRPERLRSEAAWAHLCAVAPIPASSGKTS
jgi:hypothetical protein